jgi:oxygen-independent coproporphyrinogen III oxidase
MSDKFGIYIHIPYCLQRCTYCDFATYVFSEILPPEKYVSLVKAEIQHRSGIFNPHKKQIALSTVYFGGGTPSLIPAELIVDLISELAKHGFTTGPQTEITIEINPATVDEKKLNTYLSNGVNRFSVGAQTFSDKHLKAVHREHNSKQTIQTLDLLKKYSLNFSFDLLFALPHQTIDELKYDVEKSVEMGASHISPYCLTVPEGHPLAKNRPLDSDQVEMFGFIHERLTQSGFDRYEISNYSKPNFESKHNLLYWTDQNYWGLGLSAHSYRKDIDESSWGQRFWNASNINLYEKEILSKQGLPIENQIERLKKNQSLTDFCHTALRLKNGINLQKLTTKFGNDQLFEVLSISEKLVSRNLLIQNKGHLYLTQEGILISNQVFEEFTFLE